MSSAQDLPSLTGKCVIVTGGSKGLGREMTLAIARAGASVVATARRRADLDRLQAEAPSRQVYGIVADVREEVDCEAVATAAREEFGHVDALVNNAGIALKGVAKDFVESPPKFWTIGAEPWKAIVDTNVLGPFLMTKAVLPGMLERKRGTIVNISSAPAVMRRPGWSPYGASKAALESLSITWAQELEGTGVTLNVARPGGQVATSIFPEEGTPKALLAGMLRPDVMNALIVWLLSDAANGLTGKRFAANLWDASLPAAEAAQRALLSYPELPSLF